MHWHGKGVFKNNNKKTPGKQIKVNVVSVEQKFRHLIYYTFVK